MAKKEGKFGATHLFNTAAIALAIDLLLVFPISHTSIFGQAVTAWSGQAIVPPLDYAATNWFGMQDPATALANTATQGGTQIADAGSALASPPVPMPDSSPKMVF